MDSALYNEREIQDAAQKILQTLYQGQNNGQEAYRNLYTALHSKGWRLLAGELKQWVEETKEVSPVRENRKSHPCLSFILKLSWHNSLVCVNLFSWLH